MPPPKECDAIVRFLDYTDRLMNRYIGAKKKLVALLGEQKQTIIRCAVTRGLNADVRVRHSDVEWLGDVPENWSVIPLRRVTIARCDGPFGSGLKSSHYTDCGVRVIRLQNIGHGEFKEAGAAYIAPEYYETLGDHDVLAGDVLIAGLGDDRNPAGRACVAPAHIAPAMVKADCFRFRLKRELVDPDFLALQLTATASDASAILGAGATRQRVNLESTASRWIALPPPPYQRLIVEHVRRETAGPRAAAAAIDAEVQLILEYRARLIADIVTGKLDVRGAAARLSDEHDDLRAEMTEDPGEGDADEDEDEELEVAEAETQ
jgi:type I restriction enzyme S subunit